MRRYKYKNYAIKSTPNSTVIIFNYTCTSDIPVRVTESKFDGRRELPPAGFMGTAVVDRTLPYPHFGMAGEVLIY